jgi:CHAD domain-containing protein
MDHRAAPLVLLTQRLTTLIDAMPAAQAGNTRSVHQARVATRRLRGALPVLCATVDEDALARADRQVRRMTRALGPVRELDVALGHLGLIARRRVVSASAAGHVRQALTRERLDRRRDMLAAITPGAIEKLRQRLGTVAHGPDSREGALAEAEYQVRRRARALTAAIDHAGRLYLADRLHRVRVAAKKLRYAMEVDRELKRSHVTARITQLKRLQDLLGLMHDYEMLIDRTRQVQTAMATTDRTTAEELDALVRTLEDECRRHHATYMRRRPSILELCDVLLARDAGEPRAARPADRVVRRGGASAA